MTQETILKATINPPSPIDQVERIMSKSEEASHDDASFLEELGLRVRELRERRGMTRKLLARDSRVSERHLAHLEVGEGNVSIVLLRRIAFALDVSILELLSPKNESGAEHQIIRHFLERVPQHRLEEVVFQLMRDFGHDDAARSNRIALIGLRGAGKSTLGKRLAQAMTIPFVELVSEIEKEVSLPVGEIFSLYGQPGYRRFEKRTLERILKQHDRMVLSIGGGIVAQRDTYRLLLSHCTTVWLKARPEEHMARVIAQGDFRPMAGNDEAMEDLRRILEAREALYNKADKVLDTSLSSIDETFNKLMQLISA